jgi:hypothetical protein
MLIGKSGKLDRFVFCAPTDPEASIWRYMDLAKYISMLSKNSLYFANALTFKDDPFEGSLPQKILEARRQTSRESVEKLYKSALKTHPEQGKFMRPIEEVLEMEEKYRSWERNYTFVNCWHIGEGESFPMWKIYGAEKKAIAIRSTISKLETEVATSPSLLGFGEGTDFLSIGVVKYGDFKTLDDPSFHFPFTRAFLKRNNFSYENELRVVLGKMTGRIIEPGYFYKSGFIKPHSRGQSVPWRRQVVY